MPLSGKQFTDLIPQLQSICGKTNVIYHADELRVYECDAYTLEKMPPDAVVLPGNTSEVEAVIKLCRDRNLAIIPRGSGTSLSGGVLAVDGGVVIGLSRMNRILDVDFRNRRALVEAGCINVHVTQAVQSEGYLYAPDPSSQFACTIGGNVATNSGGPHTLKYGVTTNHVLGMEMVLPDGETVWLGTQPGGPEDIDGCDLRGAAIGSEGMFGIVTRVLLRLIKAPQSCKTMLGIFESVDDAASAVSDIIAAGIIPAALEMMDQLIIQAVEEAYKFGFPLDAGAVLIIELDGQTTGLSSLTDQIQDICRNKQAREVRIAASKEERALIWKCRKRAFGAIGRLSPNYLTQDGVVPRSRIPEMMKFIKQTAEKYQLRIPNVFHAGDGNIHPLILFDEKDKDQVKRAIQAGHDILGKCIDFGGSISGEHGIGVEKVDFMSRQFSPEDLEAMMKLRKTFDPDMRCNPDKCFPSASRCIDFTLKKQISA
ncbi:MAG TPA: FAD-binding protein [Verrucomicrobiales bacterium]|jgi:glycolate oxidase|nr:FAD-binding protein [Verrucomicrobiales bacterium]